MKLNKSEMNIIAGRITAKVMTAKEKKHNETIKQIDKNNLVAAKTISDELQLLSKKTKTFLLKRMNNYRTPYFTKVIKVNEILPFLRKIENNDKSRYSIEQDILDELIISQIECPDINVLIKKVSKKFGI